jgi:dipeptidyl aminopeptidase/acylaminoacyl peptidase
VFIPFIDRMPEVGVYEVLSENAAGVDVSKHCIFCCCPAMTNGDKRVPRLYNVYFKGATDDVVHAWFVSPADIDDDCSVKSRGLVVLIHGGPQGSFLNFWNVQRSACWYASLGFAVLAVNFHGSSGFGQAFMDA